MAAFATSLQITFFPNNQKITPAARNNPATGVIFYLLFYFVHLRQHRTIPA